MDKLISIVLPTYNGSKFIKQSIESIIKQSYKNWELIIVNDASTDNTLEIIEEFLQDSRIKLISNSSNLKLPKSLNIGFKNAKGSYLTWTSDDNYYKEQALEKMLQFLEENQEFSMVCTNFTILYKHKTKLNNTSVKLEDLLNGNSIGACFLYRREILTSIGFYDENKFLIEDYDYWLRIALVKKIAKLEDNLYFYRVHQKSLGSKNEMLIFERKKEVIKHYLPLFIEKFEYLKNTNCYKDFLLYEKMDALNCGDDKIIKELNEKYDSKKLYSMYKKYYKLYANPLFLKAIRRLGFFYRIKAYKLKKKLEPKKIKLSNVDRFHLAFKWLEKNIIMNNDSTGVIVSTDKRLIYPEVSGYFIPTLLCWGEKERAKQFVDYLITIQNENGSFNDPYGKCEYTFDTGQILKGLWEFVDENEKYKNAFLKGCDYICSMQRNDGSIATKDDSLWGLAYGKKVPESIHLYCLEPLLKATKRFKIDKYELCVKRALEFYLNDKNLTNFDILSHFNAYIIEALIDLGETQRAKKAMEEIAKFQNENGAIPAYSHVKFVCSTGLFQYALCWYKLGINDKANKAFHYALSLQNLSGGWYGSYGFDANYFPESEISWATKYFLDALYFKLQNEAKEENSSFLSSIREDDGRYLELVKQIKPLIDRGGVTMLDIGIGKARYEKNLYKLYPQIKYYGLNFCYSDGLPEFISMKEGSFLDLPYEDESFDFVFACESLEHAIDIKKSLKQIYRVLKKDGILLIIDKNIKKIKSLKIGDFEQYFDADQLKTLMQESHFEVEIKENVPYEGKQNNLFIAWVGKK